MRNDQKSPDLDGSANQPVIGIQKSLSFRNPHHFACEPRALIDDAIHVRESKRFSACIHKSLELSFEALFLNPLVGPIASLNAVHRLEHGGHAA